MTNFFFHRISIPTEKFIIKLENYLRYLNQSSYAALMVHYAHISFTSLPLRSKFIDIFYEIKNHATFIISILKDYLPLNIWNLTLIRIHTVEVRRINKSTSTQIPLHCNTQTDGHSDIQTDWITEDLKDCQKIPFVPVFVILFNLSSIFF